MVMFLHLFNIFAAVMWYKFLQRKLRYLDDKQSPRIIGGFLLAGFGSIFVTMLYHILYPLPYIFPGIRENDLLYHVLVTGIIEEWAKWTCFVMAVLGGGTIREPQDGILQAAAVGLGFGTIENIGYINMYPSISIAIRPIICTGGHMIYAAFWGHFFSAAVYSNVKGKDPQSLRLALLSVFIIALIHGIYNTLASHTALFIALIPDLIILVFTISYFLRTVETSPYRSFPLHRAKEAVEAIQTGLFFNRKSPILNRRMGIFLMRLGQYKKSTAYFSRAMPRLNNRRGIRFFKSVCEFAVLGGTPGRKALRKSWAALPDESRTRLMKELETLLKKDTVLLNKVKIALLSPFSEKKGKSGYALARELKERRARQRHAQLFVKGR